MTKERGGNVLKKLTSETELQDILALSEYAFNFSDIAEFQESFLKVWQHTDNWGIVEDGQLTSQILVFPFHVNVFGQAMKMAGIGNVATYPEYRGTGGIRQLFTAIFEELKENGTVLSYLAPFYQPFYRKFGYEAIFSKIETKVNRQEITQLANETTGSMKRVDKSQEKWRKVIKKLYADTLAKDTGSVIREDWWWQNRFDHAPKTKYAICFDDAAKPVGYMAYEMAPGEMVIHEISYLNGFAIRKMASFIASHSGTFETFRFSSKLSEQVKLLFTESRPVAQVINEGMMVKIISLEGFIDQYSFNVKGDRSFLLAVEDQVTPWNQGTWKLTVEAGKGSLRLVSDSLLPEADFSGSIQSWTQVLLGRTTLETQLFLGNMTADSKRATRELSEVLPESDLALHDYF